MPGFDATFDDLTDLRLSRGLGGLFYGAHPATVTDIKDPARHGRVRVKLPWSPDGTGGYEAWARVATLMAGKSRGSWFMPDVGDEVLVVFGGGESKLPFVIGGLWNGQDTPTETMDEAGDNNIKSIRSRNGVKVTFDDTQGEEKLILETPGGQRVTLQDSAAEVLVEDSNGNSVTMNSSGISVDAQGSVTVTAGGDVTINASAMTVNAGTATFSGTVIATTVTATLINGTTYTPGAGNTW